MSHKRHNFKYGYPLQRKLRYSGGGSSSMTSSLHSSIHSSDGSDTKRASVESSNRNKNIMHKFGEQNSNRQYSIMENDIRASCSIEPSSHSTAVNNPISTKYNSQSGKNNK